MYDDMDVGYRITSVALGIDAFERKEQQGTGSLDTEGLIPIYLGGDMVVPRQYTRWQAVQDDLDALTLQVSACPETSRRLFLEALLRSLR
ncbi:MAG: hypothetical protein VB025_04405, partial [Sphaerochaeta sp.]|nr:hypothetical protein [Sphaerochaeta sp.]